MGGRGWAESGVCGKLSVALGKGRLPESAVCRGLKMGTVMGSNSEHNREKSELTSRELGWGGPVDGKLRGNIRVRKDSG